MDKVKIISKDKKVTKYVEPYIVKDFISLGWEVYTEPKKEVKTESIKKADK